MRRLRVGKANVSYMATPNGYKIQQDSSGNFGIFRADGTELGYWTQDRFIFLGQNGNGGLEIALNNQNTALNNMDILIRTDNFGRSYISSSSSNWLFLNFDSGQAINIPPVSGLVTAKFFTISLVGLGLCFLFGIDNRIGLTAVDASPKTLYPQLGQPAITSGQLYRLSGRIMATAGTSPSATYTLKWTEGGAIITKSLTISALDVDSDFSALIQPDANTSITAQLTAIGGTGTTVNVASSVERLA